MAASRLVGPLLLASLTHYKLVAGTVGTADPVTWGMPAAADLYSSTSPAFELTVQAPAGTYKLLVNSLFLT